MNTFENEKIVYYISLCYTNMIIMFIMYQIIPIEESSCWAEDASNIPSPMGLTAKSMAVDSSAGLD
jgi:hypothetical protein